MSLDVVGKLSGVWKQSKKRKCVSEHAESAESLTQLFDDEEHEYEENEPILLKIKVRSLAHSVTGDGLKNLVLGPEDIVRPRCIADSAAACHGPTDHDDIRWTCMI